MRNYLNTHNAYKKRLAGYYPPAENEDKSTVAYYTRHYYLVLLTDKHIKKSEPNKSPYRTIAEKPKSEKYNIPHASNIGGGLSKIFLGKFWNKKREPPKITLGSSQLTSCGCPLHRTTLFSVVIF